MGCAVAGLSIPARVRRDAGPAAGDDRGFLANVVGAQLDDCSHVDQAARTRQGSLRKFTSNIVACTVLRGTFLMTRTYRNCQREVS